MSGGLQLGKKGRWSCLPRLPNDRRETAREDPAGLPPVDHEQGCQGDPLLVVLDPGQDPDQEQVGRRGLLGGRLPEEEGEDQRRREKGEGLKSWLREGLGRRGVPELNGSMTPVP